jgi:hypothetical protein
MVKIYNANLILHSQILHFSQLYAFFYPSQKPVRTMLNFNQFYISSNLYFSQIFTLFLRPDNGNLPKCMFTTFYFEVFKERWHCPAHIQDLS